MSTEQFRALAAVCLMVITVCCVVAAFQLNGMKVAEQRQACLMLYIPSDHCPDLSESGTWGN
jgi:hypothetical protein